MVIFIDFSFGSYDVDQNACLLPHNLLAANNEYALCWH